MKLGAFKTRELCSNAAPSYNKELYEIKESCSVLANLRVGAFKTREPGSTAASYYN